MFKLDDLLSLFPNENTRIMLVYSYYSAQDKELSDSVFEQLLLLKSQNPSINIVLDTSKERSYFSPDENVIYINNLSIETFLHELTHLLSYNYSRFQIPNEYHTFKRDFLSNADNTSLIVQFLDLCKKEKNKIFQSYGDNSDKNIDYYNIKSSNKMIANKQELQTSQLDLISKIEDIIDSIYDGQSFSYGITSIKDNKNVAIKAKKTAGHGCEYFSDSGYQFEEILADYLAIKLTDPNNALFMSLKSILGTEFVTFLDKRCNEICGQISKIEINNYVSKK